MDQDVKDLIHKLELRVVKLEEQLKPALRVLWGAVGFILLAFLAALATVIGLKG